MNEFIKEAVMKRFDALTARAEKLQKCAVLREQARSIEHLLMDKVPDHDKHLFSEWQDLHDQIVAYQEQWLYVKGLQDGIRLLNVLLFSEETVDSAM